MDLTKYSNKELEEILLSLDDYESIPVDIETFITDPYYLGDNFTNGFREYWMRVLKEIYPSPVLSPYSIVFLRGCLSYSTPIKTNEGIIPIGKLATNFYQREVPIFVHSWDERHNRPVLRRIIDAFSTGLKEVYEITFCDSSSIRCTPDHLFLNRDLNWVSINDGIHIGTKLLGNTVYSIRHVGVRLVYDLTIEETHNFTLGNNIIAHNSIGRGKTTTVAIGLLYDIYLLLCRNSPQEYLGLTPKTKIAFALFSISMDLASDVVLGTVMGLLSTSPYFSAIMREAKRQRLGTTFTKGIEFFVGSKLIHSLGRAVHSSLLDEASFSTSQTQVYDNFNSLLRRMQSRSLGGNEGAFSMSGKAWVVSSESSKNSTLNTMLQRYIGKPGVYVDGGDLSNSALWHVVPEKYKKDRFQVFIGTEAIPPRIIDFDEESERLLRNYRDLIIEVPEEHYNDFDADLHRAIQDLAGVGTVSTYRLFRLRERLNNLFSITKIFPEHIYLDFDDERQIWDSLLNPQYFKNPIYPQFQRHIHIDIGLTNDSLGIASSLIYDWKYVDIFSKDTFEKIKEYVPATLTEFAIAIRPTEGKEIPLFKIRNFINYIAQQGINIRSISCDSYQSYDLLQIMKANGFYTEKLSVDKTCIPYFTLRDQTYRLLQFYPESDLLKKELNELEVHKDYIDHPLDGCFPGDTEILLDDGSTISFLQMYNNPHKEYRTISSHLGKPVSSFIRKVFLSKYAYKLMKITIDNSPPILCTLNHPFLLPDNSYRFARFLSTSDKVLTFYKDIGVLAPASITSIEMIELNNSIPVFDIEVPLYHNFALANGSIVHNSKDTADAVCGSVFMALKYADETKIQFLNKEDTISPEITDLFWGR